MKPDINTSSPQVNPSLSQSLPDPKSVEIIDRIFMARSIAVVGASADTSKYGFMTLDTLTRGGYDGMIFPVNPKGGEILGLKTYRSLMEIPSPLDLVVIIVPFQFVAGVIKEAALKGAAGVVICSGGFREAGRADLEAELQQIGRQNGIRLLGPNISGIAFLPNKMCAQFFPVFTVSGPLAVVAQSGSVTTGLCEWASDEGIGISAGINLGNQVDVNESDYLEFFARNAHTRSIVMYLESVSDGRRVLSALEKIVPQKGVVIIKGGRTDAGKRSTASHTGAMASSHEVFGAACRQVGAVLSRDIETAYDCAKALATMREVKGNRLVCVSTSGGANTLAMDEMDSHDLRVLPLPAELVKRLSEIGLPPLASFSNPIDLVSIRAEDFKKAVLEIDRHDVADVILLNFADPVEGEIELVKELDSRIRAALVVSYFAGGAREKEGRWALSRAGFPVFSAPERAIRGIASKVWRSGFLRKRGLTV